MAYALLTKTCCTLSQLSFLFTFGLRNWSKKKYILTAFFRCDRLVNLRECNMFSGHSLCNLESNLILRSNSHNKTFQYQFCYEMRLFSHENCKQKCFVTYDVSVMLLKISLCELKVFVSLLLWFWVPQRQRMDLQRVNINDGYHD